jgi:RNA polymerase sigma-70 factor (ECF subfamily)
VKDDFIKKYSEKGFFFAFSLCNDYEEAKEMVQESFYRVLGKWDQYNQGQSLENWYLAILRHLYYDGLKKYEHKHGASLDIDWQRPREDSLADRLPDTNEEAMLDRLERQEEEQAVRDAVDSLNIEHKAVISLCDMQGLSYDEAAVVLGCPVGTVRSRLSRARVACRQRILAQNREAQPDAV